MQSGCDGEIGVSARQRGKCPLTPLPCSLTDRILSEVSAISELSGRIRTLPGAARPQLRRNKRIQSVHASLAIGSGSLSKGMVRAVRNAFATYDAITLCHRQEQSTAFIEYMLLRIRESLHPALSRGVAALEIPDKPGRKNQRYRKVSENRDTKIFCKTIAKDEARASPVFSVRWFKPLDTILK